MHDVDFDHKHELELTETDRRAIAQAILEQDTLELLTVGIDIGSSTSHLLFARVFLRRHKHDLSSRLVVVHRAVQWRSPILLTPFLPDGTIDADTLSSFIQDCYTQADFRQQDVDSGAVILTGEAIKRRNAKAIDEIFASESGRFVCATAGHRLESILAAHGAGATALARRQEARALHVDIGGGTTKLSLVDRGEVHSVAAFAAGGRLLARDANGSWTRVDDSARLVANELGIDTTPTALADLGTREAITARLADVIVDQIIGVPPDALGRSLELTDPLDRSFTPEYVTFSGGVAEYIFGHEHEDHGDIAPQLSAAIARRLANRMTVPSVDPGQRLRATVIGASQFTVQVSGKTIHTSSFTMFPFHNLPVVRLWHPLPKAIEPDAIADAFRISARQHDRDLCTPLALAFTWGGLPSYERLFAIAQGIAQVAEDADDEVPIALVIDGDVGQTLGRILEHDLGLKRPLVSIDGIKLEDLDFVDIGEFLDPPGVIPVVIKSLLFSY